MQRYKAVVYGAVAIHGLPEHMAGLGLVAAGAVVACLRIWS